VVRLMGKVFFSSLFLSFSSDIKSGSIDIIRRVRWALLST
jgi:hypothetical protein